MDLGLTDRVFVVTGGSDGLGLAGATALIEEGARVVIVARDPERLAAARTALGDAAARTVVGDLRDPDTADHAVSTAVEAFGGIHGALVSVGGPSAGTILEVTDDTWRSAFDLIVVGALRMARAVIEQADNPVSLAFVLSTSVREPLAAMGPSNVTRPALGMAIKQLADEIGPKGSRAVGLMPGPFATGRMKDLVRDAPDPDAALDAWGADTALKRVGQPREFGRVAAFALSDAASYLTGCMIPVDGGRLRGL